MNVGVVGVSYRTANLTLREQIAKDVQRIDLPFPFVVLSTCNRTEIYFHAEDLFSASRTIAAWLFDHPCLYTLFGVDCLRHLCKVTAGLDSAILGETDIQRQVKVAYAEASSLSAELHFLFQKALKVGKNVRSLSPVSSASLQGMLWKVVWEVFKEIEGLRVLLIGYSDVNRMLLSFFAHKGIQEIHLCTKSVPGGYDALERWDEYDLIVSATQAPDFLIRPKACTGSKLLFDLSVPRTIDPSVGQGDTLLLNIDDLIERRSRVETNHLTFSEEFVESEAIKLVSLYESRRLVPVQMG